MLLLFPLMEAIRGGGDLRLLGGEGPYEKTVVCPDGCVIFRLRAEKHNTESGNFFTGDALRQGDTAADDMVTEK